MAPSLVWERRSPSDWVAQIGHLTIHVSKAARSRYRVGRVFGLTSLHLPNYTTLETAQAAAEHRAMELLAPVIKLIGERIEAVARAIKVDDVAQLLLEKLREAGVGRG